MVELWLFILGFILGIMVISPKIERLQGELKDAWEYIGELEDDKTTD